MPGCSRCDRPVLAPPPKTPPKVSLRSPRPNISGLGLCSETHRSSPVSEFCNMINMSSRKDARSSYHPLLVSHPLECKNILQCFEHSRHGQRFDTYLIQDDTGQWTTLWVFKWIFVVCQRDGQASPTKVVASVEKRPLVIELCQPYIHSQSTCFNRSRHLSQGSRLGL